MKNKFSSRIRLLAGGCLVMAGVAAVLITGFSDPAMAHKAKHSPIRSEERRGGQECRSRW